MSNHEPEHSLNGDGQFLLQDVQAFREENQRLHEQLHQHQNQLLLLESQVNELEADALIQEQLLSQDLAYLRRFEELFLQSPQVMLLIDHHCHILEINDFGCRFLGIDRERLINKNLRSFLRKESSVALIGFIKQVVDAEKDQIEPDFVSPKQKILALENGELIILEVTQFRGIDAVGQQFVLCLHPLSSRHLSSQSLYLANTILEQLREGVCITDTKGQIIKINMAFTEITGYTEPEVLGQTPAILNSGRHSQSFYQSMWQELQHHGWWSGEIWNRRKSGEVYPEWLQISRVHNDHSGQTFYVGIFSDITERKNHQDQLDRLAFYDVLTGLPNRTLLTRFLETKLLRVPEQSDQMAVIFVDLDKFKEVNDHYGHAEGDLVLREATQRIMARIRDNDLASRIGGDEFVLVLSRLQKREDAEVVVKDLIDSLSQPYITAKSSHRLSASIGVAFYPAHGHCVEDLMRRADAAMYKAKAQGRNTWQVFDEEHEVQIIENNKLIQLVWQAIEAPERYIQMHYQPIFSGSDPQQPVEYEALVRLQDGEGKLIYPDQFIEVAEQKGAIEKLGLAIFQAVCFDCRTQALPSDVRVSINLSAMQFRTPELAMQLERIARSYDHPIHRFDFEVTETAIMHNLGLMSQTLIQLQSQHSRILLDDFGTGYASLSMLKNLPVDLVKIDKGFTYELDRSEETQTLVSAMIAMAHALKLKVVVEGVENQAQLDWLLENKADYLQGYLLGKPQIASVWMGGGA